MLIKFIYLALMAVAVDANLMRAISGTIPVSSTCSKDNTCAQLISTAFCACRSYSPCTIALDIDASYAITPGMQHTEYHTGWAGIDHPIQWRR